MQQGRQQRWHAADEIGVSLGMVGEKQREGVQDGDGDVYHVLVGGGAQQPVEELGRDTVPQEGDGGPILSQLRRVVQHRFEQGQAHEPRRVVLGPEKLLDLAYGHAVFLTRISHVGQRVSRQGTDGWSIDRYEYFYL